MIKRIPSTLFALLLFVLAGCQTQLPTNTEIAEADPSLSPITLFGGTADGESWQGDGIAFYEGDSITSIKGLWGNADSYFEIEINLKGLPPGVHQLGTAGAFASITQKNIQDTMRSVSYASEQESDRVTFEWHKETNRVSGKFEFLAVGHGYSFPVKGYFNDIDVKEIGHAWACDFDSDQISDCWFID